MNQKDLNNQFKEVLADHAKHLKIANSEMSTIKEYIGGIRIDIATQKNDTAWLKKGALLIAGSSIAGLISNLMK